MRKLAPLVMILALALAACGQPVQNPGIGGQTPAAESAAPAGEPTSVPTPTSEATPTPTPEVPEAPELPPVVIEQPENLTEEIVPNDDPAAAEPYEELTQAEKDVISGIEDRFGGNLLYEIDLEGSRDKEGTVKYDFNGDGLIETLEYALATGEDRQELTIALGNSRIECLLARDVFGQVYNFRALGLCDVDREDGVIDFFITKVSYNGVFERTSIYRLNEDDEIVALLGLDTGISGVSGDGKVYYFGGNLKETYDDNFNPDYVISYYDIYLGEYVETDQIVGKQFADLGGWLMFENREDVPTGAPVEMTDDLPGVIRRLADGEIVTVLEMPRDDVVKVEASGTVGWMGGFHMVWD